MILLTPGAQESALVPRPRNVRRVALRVQGGAPTGAVDAILELGREGRFGEPRCVRRASVHRAGLYGGPAGLEQRVAVLDEEPLDDVGHDALVVADPQRGGEG